MAQQLETAQQVADLRSQFFPTALTISTKIQNYTRLTDDPTLDALVAASRVPFYVQCDCACK